MRTLIGTALSVVSCVLLSAAQQPAKPAAAPASGPEIRGLYLGMPEAAARRQLQSLSDSARVQSESPSGFTILNLAIPGDGGSDFVRVLLTAPPQPPVVWLISYSQLFQNNPLERGTFMQSLRGKYGKENASAERGTGNNLLMWLYDEQWQRTSSMDARMMDMCGSNNAEPMGQRLVTEGPTDRNLREPFGICAKSYVGLSVMVNGSPLKGPELVGGYSMTLVSLPLATRAGAATAAARNGAAEAERQKELEDAKKRKPAF
jgi:hypothetical protein